MSIKIKSALVKGKIADILIENEKITQIAAGIPTEAEYKIDAKGMAVIPSFCNGHAHAAMTLFRGYADDMVLNEWLNSKIWPLEAKLTEKDVYWGTRLACLEMIKSGTTFFNDMYWHFHGTARAADESGIRSLVSAVMIDMFDQEKAAEQIKMNKRLFQESRQYSDRIRFALGPHALYTVSAESLQWFREFSDKHEIPVHFHLSETKKEVDDCIAKNRLRPVEYLDELGFLSDKLLACHSIWLNDKEISLMKKHNATVVHNPVSNMKLCSGSVFPYQKYKKAGVRMALGTDGAASNNSLDMLSEMKTAALLQKHMTGDPTALKAGSVFNMATNGLAFGLDTGIAEGKLADLLLVNLRKPCMTPCHSLISNIAYAADTSVIDTTICNGKVLMQNRHIEGEQDILDKAQEVVLDFVSR